MDKLRVGLIGVGRPFQAEGATGFGMARAHAAGYVASEAAAIVAVADIKPENSKSFREAYPYERAYTDYRKMLAQEKLDMVSICTWPHQHAEMIAAAAEAGVKAVHCEKPVAPSWSQAKKVVQLCARRGLQLTFNHQRRFERPYRLIREMLKSGRIGQLQRMEMSCDNMFDWGTHWFDMMFFYNGQRPATSVLAQVDPSDGPTVFAIKHESAGISFVSFSNNVQGLMVTGAEPGWGAMQRLTGSEGVIELGASGWESVRVWSKGSAFWEEVDAKEPEGALDGSAKAVIDAIESLKTGREPELSARKALMATELIFATYESSRTGSSVEIPLAAEDAAIRAFAD